MSCKKGERVIPKKGRKIWRGRGSYYKMLTVDRSIE